MPFNQNPSSNFLLKYNSQETDREFTFLIYVFVMLHGFIYMCAV